MAQSCLNCDTVNPYDKDDVRIESPKRRLDLVEAKIKSLTISSTNEHVRNVHTRSRGHKRTKSAGSNCSRDFPPSHYPIAGLYAATGLYAHHGATSDNHLHLPSPISPHSLKNNENIFNYDIVVTNYQKVDPDPANRKGKIFKFYQIFAR